MEIESLVEEILDSIYHAATFHEDPVVQEQIARVDITNLLEDYIEGPRNEEETWELRDLERQVSDLEDEVAALEYTNEKLKNQVNQLFEEAAGADV